MRLRELVIDAWSWLNYKPAMADPHRPGHRAFPEVNSSWVPEPDRRRLAAYELSAACDSNQAGQLAAVTGDHDGVERRELDDPSKLIDTTLGRRPGRGPRRARRPGKAAPRRRAGGRPAGEAARVGGQGTSSPSLVTVGSTLGQNGGESMANDGLVHPATEW